MVNDPTTNTRLNFIDNDRTKRGFEESYIGNTNIYHNGFPNGKTYWEYPMYNIAKNATRIGIGTSGIIAGALEAKELTNFMPWRSGENLKNAVDWYRKSNGTRIPLDKLKNGRGAAGGQNWCRICW